jgi:predicted enzyme related to lactoylglutathione lyase
MQKERYVANGIAHFDVAGPNLSEMTEFYKGVFGWEILSKGPGYSLAKTPDGSVNGALIESDEPGLTMGVTVPNLQKALDAAIACGGTVLMPATDNGWVTKGQVKDPAGNIVSLIQA